MKMSYFVSDSFGDTRRKKRLFSQKYSAYYFPFNLFTFHVPLTGTRVYTLLVSTGDLNLKHIKLCFFVSDSVEDARQKELALSLKFYTH